MQIKSKSSSVATRQGAMLSSIELLKNFFCSITMEYLKKKGLQKTKNIIQKITDGTLITAVVLKKNKLDFSHVEKNLSEFQLPWIKLTLQHFESSVSEFLVVMRNTLGAKQSKQIISSAYFAMQKLPQHSEVMHVLEKLIPSDMVSNVLLPQSTRDIFKKLELSLIIHEKSTTDVKRFIKPKKGRNIPVSISGSMMENKKGEVSGFLLVAKDLRELQRYAKTRVDSITPVLHQISLGDFGSKIELPHKEDEFTNLIVAIDLMSRNLQDIIEENENKTNQLEKSEKQLRDFTKKIIAAKTSVEHEKNKAETLLASIGEGIVATDKNGRIILMNHAAEKLFGLKLSDVIAQPFISIVSMETEHGHHIPPKQRPTLKALSNKKKIKAVYNCVFKDKKRIPCMVTVSPIFFNKKISGVIATFHDIAKEKEIDKAKTEFVSLASHQLRTPLTGIKWILQEIMRKGHLNRWQTEYIHDAFESNERLIALVNDLLNVSRLEAGALIVEPEKVCICDEIGSIVKEMRLVAKNKKQTIQFTKQSAHINIKLDKQLFRQVLVNLLSNAIKYSGEKTTVVVKTWKVDGKVCLSVKDRGVGISKEDQKTIFEKFFRSDDASKFSTTSTGLGLYVINRILKMSGGSIAVKSTKGKGATFTVCFPATGMKARGGTKRLI